ncbi:conserved hypothetical protein [Curtobacterium sp. 8I-2]|nr:conserved hypothetical protein [Curtobacterium sp. 8I-2]
MFVQPLPGVRAAELPTTLGPAPFVRLPGTLGDPRVVTLTSEVRSDLHVVSGCRSSRC